MRLGLAHHVIVIVVFTSGANEVGGAHQGGGAGADFVDFGDGVGEGGCVDEDCLVEAMGRVSGGSATVGGLELPGLSGSHDECWWSFNGLLICRSSLP